MRLFISYRRADSGGLVDHLKETLGRDHHISAFVDRDDIAKGIPFPVEIEAGIRDAQVVLAVIGPSWVTGRQVEEDWCYRELNFAHQLAGDNPWRKPIVPVLHGNAEIPKVDLVPKELGFLAELNSVHFDPNRPTVEEIARLAEHLVVVDRIMAIQLQPGQPLAGLLIGLSAAPPNPDEFRADDQSPATFLFFVEVLVRRLLAKGTDVSFAGLDPTATGFSAVNLTYRLRELAGPFAESSGRDRVFNYLRPDARVPDYGASDGFTHRTTSNRFRDFTPSGRQSVDTALAYLAMREAAADDCDARICVGGKVSGFAGRLPGALEEVVLALQRERPVYVLGGYGGVSGVIAQQLAGEAPDGLTLKGQLALWPEEASNSRDSYVELVDQLAASPQAVSYAQIRRLFGPSWTALRNGLAVSENVELATTVDADRAAELLVSDLSRLPRQPGLRDPTAPIAGAVAEPRL
jgi:hypothetical protein